MCGIAGIYHFAGSDKVDRAVLEKMTASIAHRGPDGEGIWIDDNVGFGHRRLAILDPTPAGAQPMRDPVGRYIITFNGEIYNFRELRKVLESDGYLFTTGTDTEVLLAGFSRWGKDLAQKLLGMFAFAIWDCGKKELFLVRDRLGIKPLFFSLSGTGFYFGSEVKAILSVQHISREVDEAALDEFFTYSYIPAPRTGFKAVRQILPGHFATINSHGMQSFCYWSPADEKRHFNGNFNSAKEEFTELLDQAVHSHMVSDVPIGAFLSGGLDSAGVVSSMAKFSPQRVSAFTASFSDNAYDESNAAKAVASQIGVNHLVSDTSCKPETFIRSLSAHLEEPFADSSSLAVYQICAAARQNVKVVLSGDGADELLAGYPTLAASRIARIYRVVPKLLRKSIVAPVLQNLPFNFSRRNSQDLIKRFIYGVEQGIGRDHAAWRVIFREDEKDSVFNADFRSRSKNKDPYGEYAMPIYNQDSNRDFVSRLLEADLRFYLTNDMLVKMDRMSMAHGLEVRVPYLDAGLVAFCLSLPSSFKLRFGYKRKHILRESLRGKVPDWVLKQPKTGFNVPLARWMKEDLYSMFCDLLKTHELETAQYFNITLLNEMLRRHKEGVRDFCHELFTVLIFLLWLENKSCAWR